VELEGLTKNIIPAKGPVVKPITSLRGAHVVEIT
jgi:hypothetical protein